MKSTLSITRVSSSAEFELLEESWNRLLSSSPSNNYFLRWEWLWAWWESFGAELGDLCILLLKRRERLVGIAPFYVTRHKWGGILPVNQLLFLGTSRRQFGYVGSEYLDVICEDTDSQEVVEVLFQYIEAEQICDEMYLFHIDSRSRTMGHFVEKAISRNYLFNEMHRWKCPYIALPGSWEEFLGKLSSAMRYKLRKHQREIRKHGDYLLRRTTCVDELDKDFAELVRLHQLRWESRGMSGVFSDSAYASFLKRVLQHMLQHHHLFLYFLSVSGRNVAAVLNIAYRNKFYYYQSGLDTEFDRKIALGTLAHSLCVQEAIKNKLEEYDFLLKGSLDDYKDRWTKEHRELCDYYLVAPGIHRLLAGSYLSVRQFLKRVKTQCQ